MKHMHKFLLEKIFTCSFQEIFKEINLCQGNFLFVVRTVFFFVYQSLLLSILGFHCHAIKY